MTITKAILVANDIPILLSGVLAVIFYRRFEKKFKIFSWFLICSSIIQIIALIFWFVRANNMPLLHLYVPLGFVLLAWFYQAVLESFINKGIIVTVTLLFLCFSIINSVFFENIHIFNSNALTVESILLIIFSIFTFIVLLNQQLQSVTRDVKQSLSWINSGILIYYSTTLLLFYFSNYLMHHHSVNISAFTWMFHSFASITMYCCILVGLWKRGRKYH
ncbi:hypothetical protein [Mucilaginibacter paludis]|uniref:Uncharacterized protein n=1 Tax=Mucilaginibacter paludis DSM 18603 TaxID=714943 RepID=H1YAA7_9SPHI|nr:hypothetical protein [Mucilaginibacter paludis]EHQ25988.1 hypothetical protein Mucpa_1835 [Mucilaginibacter paludis DSM 18603]